MAEAQRILDRAARRLLAARLDGDPVSAAAREDHGALDDGTDKSALLVESEQIPVTVAVTVIAGAAARRSREPLPRRSRASRSSSSRSARRLDILEPGERRTAASSSLSARSSSYAGLLDPADDIRDRAHLRAVGGPLRRRLARRGRR